nr:MAG TPA: adenine-specific methyltransferase [Caudoviricetes sp.]
MRRWAADGVKAQTCVTSPPYFGLRDYGHDGQIGLEQTPEEYIAAMVEVFRCVRDVLADDGTLWLNIGDSYATGTKADRQQSKNPGVGANRPEAQNSVGRIGNPPGCKTKDLIGIPWMLAFALRADGWYLRQDIIWHKPNPMPESVRDRCTKAHEYIFLLSKSERYFYDHEASKESAVSDHPPGNKTHKGATAYAEQDGEFHRTKAGLVGYANRVRERKGCPNGAGGEMRNRRSVWTVATRPYRGAHFATFPPALIEPCILAGSRSGDVVLDPFMGSGTTAQVALQHGRQYMGCELNEEYKALQDERIAAALDDVKNSSAQYSLHLEASA